MLGGVNGKLLDDPRVKIFAEDVFPLIARVPQATYDAILLDLDDGPAGFLQGRVSYTYDRRGCLQIARALQPDGCAAFWSAAEDQPFGSTGRRFAGAAAKTALIVPRGSVFLLARQGCQSRPIVGPVRPELGMKW